MLPVRARQRTPPTSQKHAMIGRVRMSHPSAGFRFVDLFAGIGGTRLAFERSGGQCVFTSEWNKYAEQTYRENFDDGRADHDFVGDITQVRTSDIPDHDVLVAGFPCQPFSLAGVSKKNSMGRPHGFDDKTQGTLFRDVARILAEKRPRAFMLENVRNLVSHDGGRTFEIIMEVLEQDLDYKVSWRVVDASPWVPQKRRRIILVGFDGSTDFDFDNTRVPDAHPTLQSILHPEDGTELPEPPFTYGRRARVDQRYTLTPRLWDFLRDYRDKHQRAGHGFGYSVFEPHEVARTLSARYYKDGSEILISRGPRSRPRRLTPRECARLMGFPSDFQIPVSDSQAYKQFGNSVVVPLIESVAQEIRRSMWADRTSRTGRWTLDLTSVHLKDEVATA